MTRRDFLRTGTGGALAGAATMGGADRTVIAATAAEPVGSGEPAVLAAYGPEDHRRRLENVAFCQTAIRSCMRKHQVTNYLPGQACYNLCEYPSRTLWAPNDYDEQELDRLRDHGIELIQVFDDWNDSLRLFGGHKLRAINPDGFRRFVEMVHARGMKIIAYVSTGFLQVTDPDLRPEWYREGDILVVGYWNMARCSPASAGWRAYLLPRILRVLDDYGVDGLYNDGGYVTNAYHRVLPATNDEVAAFEESPDFDGAWTDLMSLVYAEVKRRGGILKLHVNGADRAPTRDVRVYDYLWVGEGVNNADQLRDRVKDYPPYVVPCIDMNFAATENEDEPYLLAVPYLQFPLLPAGRPLTGERGMVPGVNYAPEDFWMKRCREAWAYYQAHPDGPYAYSQWDALPPRPETRATHARWLKQYRALAEDGTWAWLDLKDSNLFAAPLPKDIVASAFANRDLRLVLANYTRDPVDIVTADPYVAETAPAAPANTQWRLPPRSLHVLRRQA